MIDYEQVTDFLLSFAGAEVSHPFEKHIAVYSAGGNMFALIDERKQPINLSLRCDSVLAKTLRNRYETVLPGKNLSPKHWNTLVLTGQLSWEEVQDLIRLSYNLASEQT